MFRYETAAVAPWALEVAVMMICAMWSIAWWPGAGGVDRIGGQWLRYVAWMCLGIGWTVFGAGRVGLSTVRVRRWRP